MGSEGPELLTPNHILTMKCTVIAPPPGEFGQDDLYLQKRWKRVYLRVLGQMEKGISHEPATEE